jgi:phospholipid-binding lipoprotein MlaA
VTAAAAPTTVAQTLLAACRIAGVAALAVLAGCATKPPASDVAAVRNYEQINDKLEPLNRTMFDIDQAFDAALIRPVAWTYNKVVPQPARNGVTNALANVRSPITFANDLLQGQATRAGVTLWRLVINSVFGIGGLFDVAAKLGVPGHTEDFGQTLATWGVAEGSYLYLPILGPSSIRDGIGLGVDNFAFDPVTWYSYNRHNIQWIQWAYLGATLIDAKASTMSTTDELKKSSIDYYAALRSAYRQYRAKEIRNGAPPPAGSMPTFDDEDGGDPFAAEKPQKPR